MDMTGDSTGSRWKLVERLSGAILIEKYSET
jgi:hypothetical protein